MSGPPVNQAGLTPKSVLLSKAGTEKSEKTHLQIADRSTPATIFRFLSFTEVNGFPYFERSRGHAASLQKLGFIAKTGASIH